ncbi:MAG TPA: alpha-2-macroglobulin family protein, partial [Bdellovibrionales bacterium]|nr:alpha-2-macroglobulin family protein [Bdellovibrionales bacterium]
MKKFVWSLLAAALVLSMFMLTPPVNGPAEALAQSDWSDVEALVKDQKVQEAQKKTKEKLEQAKASKNHAVWTEGLIRYATYEMGLHGYETAVRILKEEAWPDHAEGRILLNLYYAHLLTAYTRMYGWEIAKREKTVSLEKPELKAWTKQQIANEIRRSFEACFRDSRLLAGPIPKFMSRYLHKNTYPDNVRPTLRDAVVYMAADHLSDSGYWTPEQSNELYKLKPADLLSTAAHPALSDVRQHPLQLMAALLNEHQQYHIRAGRREAAAEARYELHQNLHAAFSGEEDKIAIRNALKLQQSQYGNHDWWGRGQALLAQLHLSEASDDSAIEAHKAASAGALYRPQTAGSKMSLSTQKSIERPSYGFTVMNHDAAERASILVEHTNLKEIHFRAYAFDLKQRLQKGRGNDLFPSYEEAKQVLGRSVPDSSWSLTLTDPGDFKAHRTLVTPKLKTPGAYLVFASANAGFDNTNNAVAYTHFIVTGIIAESRSRGGGAYDVHVRDGATGRPVQGAKVTLYRVDWNKPPQEARSEQTGSDGYAKLALKGQGAGGYGYFLIATHNNQAAVDLSHLGFNVYEREPRVQGTLIFTDRSVYRPGHKIQWKVAAYKGSAPDAKYEVAAGQEVIVQLYDPNYQAVVTKTLKTNGYGTASGEFAVPAGRPLGQWHLRAHFKGPNSHRSLGNTFITVEEYKRPTFEVELPAPEASLRLNRAAKLKGEAKYYFGSPVSSGMVRYKVTRTPVFPWWWHYGWFGGRAPEGPQMVGSGESRLREDGTFDIEFKPEADEREKSKELTYNFTIEADVTDEGGETRSASRVIRLGFTAVEAQFEWASEYARVKAPLSVKATRMNLNGKPLKGTASYKISRVNQPPEAPLPAELPRDASKSRYQTPGDSKRARWETDWRWEAVTKNWEAGSVVAEGKLAHDEKGEAVIALREGFAEPGIYRLTYETTDEFGANYTQSRDFVVADKAPRLSLPLLALAESRTAEPGETARLLIHSGLKQQTITVEIFRKGASIKRMRLESGKDAAILELPVTEADRGGFSVVVTALRDYQLLREELSISVPWTNKQLQIETASFRDRIRPGSKETFRVTIKDFKKRAVDAEALAYMYDRSLDLFAGHHPAGFLPLYPFGAGVPPSRVTLSENRGGFMFDTFTNPPASPSFVGDQLQLVDGYGLGGPGRRHLMKGAHLRMEEGSLGAAAPAEALGDMASAEADSSSADSRKRESKGKQASGIANEPVPAAAPARAAADGARGEAPVELRTDFSETAFWKPHLLAGPDGSVTAEFQVPDSVTSWKFWVHAHTKDLRSGSLSQETRSVKELMVRPYIPRFLREGDAAEIKVVVN